MIPNILWNLFKKIIILLFVLVPNSPFLKYPVQASASTSPPPSVFNNGIRPAIRLGAPTQYHSGEHISLKFYAAAKRAEQAKDDLQDNLHNFLEVLQRNLTTSTVLNNVANTINVSNKTQQQQQKLYDLSAFFQFASETAAKFAQEAENFFEVTKNESNALLLKLRQVPSAQRNLPMQMKMHLTNYFDEMEFFHILFSEVTDEALQYIVDTLRATERTFILYADIQRDVLRHWNFKPDEWCCNRYMDFLQHWSAQVFSCAAGAELSVAYDVYAMTEVSTKYILRQLEFRIQRLFNCFIFGSYDIRCRFLRHAEQDFEKLFAKLEELQIYSDIKTKHGRVTATSSYRHRRRRHELKEINELLAVEAVNGAEFEEDDFAAVEAQDKCIPYGFPDTQMLSSLKSCFYFPDFK